MSQEPPLCPVPLDELAEALAFALRYEGRRRVNHADGMMAQITAERLVRHLQASGYVLMKSGAAAAPTTAQMPPPAG